MTTRSPLGLGLVLALGFAGCGSDVTIDGRLPGVGEVGQDQASGCTLCSGGGCGICAYRDATTTFRCTSDKSPPVGNCQKDGSLFTEGSVSYFCWYCD